MIVVATPSTGVDERHYDCSTLSSVCVFSRANANPAPRHWGSFCTSLFPRQQLFLQHLKTKSHHLSRLSPRQRAGGAAEDACCSPSD
eukprot:3387965-Rhodomonas_salina.2